MLSKGVHSFDAIFRRKLWSIGFVQRSRWNCWGVQTHEACRPGCLWVETLFSGSVRLGNQARGKREWRWHGHPCHWARDPKVLGRESPPSWGWKYSSVIYLAGNAKNGCRDRGEVFCLTGSDTVGADCAKKVSKEWKVCAHPTTTQPRPYTKQCTHKN